MTFKELVNEYKVAKSKYEEEDKNLRKEVLEYLSTWYDVNVDKIADVSYVERDDRLSVFILDRYGKYTTYEIPYSDRVI